MALTGNEKGYLRMGKLEKCILGIVAAAGTWGIYATSADAQEAPKCAPLKQFFADMRKAEMSEVAVGLINPQVSFVVFASPGGRRWVLVTIGTTGAACPIMSGTGWDNEPLVPEGQPV